MKKLLFAILLFSTCAFAQGVRVDLAPIINPRGVPIANVNISLCTGTAIISGSSCNIAAQSFTDITLGTPCAFGFPVTLTNSNTCQATSDGAGNAGFWLSPGAYIYCLNGPNITGACYNLTVPVGVTSAGNLTVGGAGTITTSAPQLTLRQTGDTFGGSSLALENRTGANGGIFINNTLALSDLGLAANTTITNIAITGNVVTVTTPATGNGWNVGSTVTLSGLTNATFLNNALLTISTASAGSFTAAFTHADYPSTPDTGIVFMQNNLRSEFRPADVIIPANVGGEIQFVQRQGTVGGGNINSNTWFASGLNGSYLRGGLTIPTTAGTLPATIQNDSGGNIQIGTTAGQAPSLTVGPNPFSAFSINPGTALVSNPVAGQARRGMTYANDPAGDVTFWYNTSQTGAGYFFKDAATGNKLAVPIISATAATLGVEYPSADHVIYVSTQGSDANDGRSPGTAKATVQAAFNAATTSGTVAGTVIVAPGAYACPTTWYSNMVVMSSLPLYSGVFAASVGTSNTDLDGVTFNCTAANLTWTLLSNLHVSGININFANAGFGLVMNSVSASEFRTLTLTGAGSNTQAALQMKTNAATLPANNTAFNRFYDLTIVANYGGAQFADCITLTGSGAVNGGTFVTDNEFHGVTCTGGIRNGIRFELNSDTNRFYGVNLNNTAAASGDALVFNSTTPASDQDADDEEVYGICETGAFNHSISMGAANGNVIQTCGGAVIVPNVLGGSPTYIVTGSGEFGVAPSIQVHGGPVILSNLVSGGPAPTCSFTGGGTGASCAIQTGSSNSSGSMILTTGTTAAATGTITLTFNGSLGTNGAGCMAEPVSGSQAWSIAATHGITSQTTSAVTWQWDNAGSALLNTSTYVWDYMCGGR